MSKRWQKVEIRYLEKHAGDKTVEELAKRFHTDVATVKAQLRKLKLDAASAGASSEAEVLERYRQGMAALYEGKWKQAEGILSGVAGEAPSLELAARARQFAETASRRAADGGEEDPYLRAVFDKNRGAFDAALAACTDGKRREKDGRFAYLAAAVECLRGNLEGSAEHLLRSFELDSRHRTFARRDPDLETLRESTSHRHLFQE